MPDPDPTTSATDAPLTTPTLPARLSGNEYGPITSVSEEVKPKQSDESAKAAEVILGHDRVRGWIGLASYTVGVLSFLAVGSWAVWSLHAAMEEARQLRYQLLITGHVDEISKMIITEPMVLMYVAKALLVGAVAGFAIALVKSSENMTMPLASYIEYVQTRYGKGDDIKGDASVLQQLSALVQALRGKD